MSVRTPRWRSAGSGRKQPGKNSTSLQLRNAEARFARTVSITRPGGTWRYVDDMAALTKARSLLLLLLATCKETQLALEAAANVLDTDLTADLKAMIERSEAELQALNAKIKALPAT